MQHAFLNNVLIVLMGFVCDNMLITFGSTRQAQIEDNTNLIFEWNLYGLWTRTLIEIGHTIIATLSLKGSSL